MENNVQQPEPQPEPEPQPQPQPQPEGPQLQEVLFQSYDHNPPITSLNQTTTFPINIAVYLAPMILDITVTNNSISITPTQPNNDNRPPQLHPLPDHLLFRRYAINLPYCLSFPTNITMATNTMFTTLYVDNTIFFDESRIIRRNNNTLVYENTLVHPIILPIYLHLNLINTTTNTTITVSFAIYTNNTIIVALLGMGITESIASFSVPNPIRNLGLAAPAA
ncbi:hypothetical protein TanjilG_07056 [Lupinus angustifolius]|uniref:Uncharacterized protein n=1 Tax=Lupinus angustifolius TaxID=3871 RepID=A0A4P1QYC9_LUPAN|nr:hypothetical protein TanjilG_07056 [Lupinus angustifolius]